MTEFTPGQTADQAHVAIKSALKSMEDAKQCFVLWFAEILERKLYRELGYSSINQYAKMELGFSSSRIGIYLDLCRHLEKLPLLKEKIVSGELGYTKAKALLPVIDESNEIEWLEVAEENTRLEVEQIVKQAKEEAKKEAADKKAGQPSMIPLPKKQPVAVVPVYVSIKMSPSQFALYEELWEQVRKNGNVSADKTEALLEIMKSFVLEESGSGQSAKAESSRQQEHLNTKAESSRQREHLPSNKPPVQIHIHQCPDCAKATVQTSKGELKLGGAELERALCDCQISKPNERNTTSIPPATRRKVLARAMHKCQQPGCNHTRFLEVHHIVPRSKGGTNDAGNLVCICSSCHQLLHDKKLRGTGFLSKESPIIYQWQSHA